MRGPSTISADPIEHMAAAMPPSQAGGSLALTSSVPQPRACWCQDAGMATFCDARKENQKAVLPKVLPARFWLVLGQQPWCSSAKGTFAVPTAATWGGQLLPRAGGVGPWVLPSSASLSDPGVGVLDLPAQGQQQLLVSISG